MYFINKVYELGVGSLMFKKHDGQTVYEITLSDDEGVVEITGDSNDGLNLDKDSIHEIIFDNGSSISIGTQIEDGRVIKIVEKNEKYYVTCDS